MPPAKRPRDVCVDCWARWLTTVPGDIHPDYWTEVPKMPRWRPAPKPGPRCVSDWRTARKEQKERAHETRTTRIYGIEPGEYGQLLAFQGGTCAIPRCPAKGVVKRLAVDHNHTTGAIRGLLCGPHNRLIGASFDDPTVFEAIAEYLRHPPYERMKHGNQIQVQYGEAEAPAPDRDLEATRRDPPSPDHGSELRLRP